MVVSPFESTSLLVSMVNLGELVTISAPYGLTGFFAGSSAMAMLETNSAIAKVATPSERHKQTLVRWRRRIAWFLRSWESSRS
jgi:hypothetical protein